MRVGGLAGTVPRVPRGRSRRRGDRGRGEGARRCLGGAFLARGSRPAPPRSGSSGSVQGAATPRGSAWPPTPLLGLRSTPSRRKRLLRSTAGKQAPASLPTPLRCHEVLRGRENRPRHPLAARHPSKRSTCIDAQNVGLIRRPQHLDAKNGVIHYCGIHFSPIKITPYVSILYFPSSVSIDLP